MAMAPYTGADADMQTRLATPWCNPGSYGHPSLCARPCIYIAKNGSCHVDGCDYCHMAHDLPVAKLNQRQRYVLQRLSVKVKMDLVLEAVRGGLHREGLTDQAESLLCFWVAQWHPFCHFLVQGSLIDQPTPPSPPPRKRRRYHYDNVVSVIQYLYDHMAAGRIQGSEQLLIVFPSGACIFIL